MDSSSLFPWVLSLHSFVRWMVLITGAIVFLQGMVGVLAGGEIGSLGKRLQLAFMINFDVQLLIGILLWVLSPTVSQARADMGEAMKDSELRYFAVEHGMVMVVALAVVHIGRVAAKRATEPRAQHLRTALYAGLALLLICMRTPWPFTEVARPWLRLP